MQDQNITDLYYTQHLMKKSTNVKWVKRVIDSFQLVFLHFEVLKYFQKAIKERKNKPLKTHFFF